MSYEPRPPPASFDDFLSALNDAQHDGIVVDEGIFDEFFADENKSGAREEMINKLPVPKDATAQGDCPVCLQSTAAILTEEEYALASEHYFGDTASLGLRQIPCGHVLCARCARAWLSLNNSCPMCRAVVDPEAPAPVDAIEAQRQTERMLALFHSLFGQGASAGASAGAGAGARPPPKVDDRSAFNSMYS